MILISHRGNITGPNPDLENKPEYILEAMRLGYDVEIDVWLKNDGWYLGHDDPQYQIPFQFLQIPGLWCHCKNLYALRDLLQYSNIISVAIDNDDYVLTSNGYIWTHTKISIPEHLTDKSIAIMPEIHKSWIKEDAYKYCGGVCSDYVGEYR